MENFKTNYETIDLDLVGFRKLLNSPANTGKIFSFTFKEPLTTTLKINDLEEQIFFPPLKFYLFDLDCILDLSNSVLFDLNGMPYKETIYGIPEKEYKPRLDAKKVSAPGCVSPLSGKWTAYYHFLMEANASLLLNRQLFPEIDLTYITSRRKKRNSFEFNNTLLKNELIVEQNFVKVNKMLINSLLYTHGNSLKGVSDLQFYLGNSKILKRDKYIFSTRGNESHSRISNLAELEDYFSNLGFEMVNFNNYNLNRQIDLVKRAKIIAGPHGANLANAIFASSGTTLLEIVPTYLEDGRTGDRAYQKISILADLKYYNFECPNNLNDKFATINLTELDNFIKKHKIHPS